MSAVSSGTVQCTILSTDLKLGDNDTSTSNDIYRLQRFLIATGNLSATITVEQSGGSSIVVSSATGHFGSLTQSAVTKYQTAQNIIATGSDQSGYVGISTRASIQRVSCSTSSASGVLTEGTTVLAGGTYQINWPTLSFAEGDKSILIVLESINPFSTRTIVSGLSNTGSFLWKVASTIPAGNYTLTVASTDSNKSAQILHITVGQAVSSPTSTPTPTTTATPSVPQIIGYFDGLTTTTANGWACSSANYIKPLRIDFYNLSEFIGSTQAYISRSGIAASCGGNAAHAFNFTLPAFRTSNVIITAKAVPIDSDGNSTSGASVTLINSPKSIYIPLPATPPVVTTVTPPTTTPITTTAVQTNFVCINSGAAYHPITRYLVNGSVDLPTDNPDHQVTRLQQFLTSHEYFTRDPLGTFSSLTQTAVKAFQADYGILQTGTAGPITRTKINEILCGVDVPKVAATPTTNTTTNTTSVASCPDTFTQNLKLYSGEGTEGTTINRDVNALKAFLHVQSATVNYFDLATQQALIQFQITHNISPAVGYFGLITRTEVNKEICGDMSSYHYALDAATTDTAGNRDITTTNTNTITPLVCGPGDLYNILTAAPCPSLAVYAPVVSSISPDSGAVGTAVTISGSNFIPSGALYKTASLLIDNSMWVDGTSNDEGTSLSAVIPAGRNLSIGAHTIKVTNRGGLTSTGSVTFNVTSTTADLESPVITSISPTSGTPSGSVPVVVTIYGTGFSHLARTSALFNGTPYSTYLPYPDPQPNPYITFTVPSSAAVGDAAVQVSNRTDTTSHVSNTFYFHVNGAEALPTISSLSANSGNVGDVITISGTNFTSSGNAITLALASSNGNSIKGFYNLSSNGASLSFTVPSTLTQISGGSIATPAGAYQVWVTNANGTTNQKNFTVIAQSTAVVSAISSLSQTSGAAGTSVTIYGTGLSAGNLIHFQGGSIGQNLFFQPSSLSGTSAHFTVPSNAASGNYSVSISNNGSSDVTNLVSFTVPEIYVPSPSPTYSPNPSPSYSPSPSPVTTLYTPSLSSISPSSGNAGGTLSLSGSFHWSSKIEFDGGTNGGLITSPTSGIGNAFSLMIPFDLPIGTHTVRVRDNSTNQLSNALGFTVTAPVVVAPATPSLSSLSPTSGTQGSPLQIYGSHFTASGNTASFSCGSSSGSRTNLTSYLQDSQVMNTTIPSFSGATYPLSCTVTISNANGTSSGLPFTVTSASAPSSTLAITSLSQASASAGTLITVTGTGFGSQPIVYIRTTNNSLLPSNYPYYGAGVNYVSSDGTSLQFTAPDIGTVPAGTYNLSVHIPTGESNALPFTTFAPVSLVNSTSFLANVWGGFQSLFSY